VRPLAPPSDLRPTTTCQAESTNPSALLWGGVEPGPEDALAEAEITASSRVRVTPAGARWLPAHRMEPETLVTLLCFSACPRVLRLPAVDRLFPAVALPNSPSSNGRVVCGRKGAR